MITITDACKAVGLRAVITTLVLVCLFLGLHGCTDKQGPSSRALAVVNGKPITVSEFELRWSQLPEYARKTYAGPDGRKRFLDELITRELLLEEAKRRGLDRERVLQERVEQFKERSILDALVREEVAARTAVTPEEIKAYYEAQRGSFTASDEFHASHILVKTEAEAGDLRKRILQGEDFAALARKASVDVTSKNKGGDLGVIRKGQTVPEFEKALLNLKVGEVSEPVATQFGYHLIKLTDRAPGPVLSFDEAKDQVREQILAEKKRKRFDELVASLRAKAKVRVADVPLPVSEPSAAKPAANAP